MSLGEAELGERLSAAWRMPYGRGQIAAVEDVIRHADAGGFADLRYAARMLATQAYTFGGEPAKAFVTFSWCLAAYDRGEAGDDVDHDLYWQFKWVVNALTKFPEVPLERAHSALDDMERRYKLAGHTMNPVHQHREVVAQHIGDVATAEEQYRLWCAAPRGDMSDCIGCEPTAKVRHLAWRGRHEDAVALALPVLGGTLTCVEQPQAILTELLLPYLHTGRLEEAAAAHREAYRAIQASRGELGMVADHVAFCARTGNEARGLELVERHLGWLDEPPTPLADMYFSASAALVLGRVADAGHADLVLRRHDAEISAGALRDELTARALALAERFDARNGTAEQGNTIQALLAAEPIVEHLPLSGPARRAGSRSAAATPAPSLSTPDELADLALRESRLHNDGAVAAAWRRFDEVCPEPSGALLARRLDATAGETANRDPAAAADLWERAAELFAEAGDEVRRHGVLGRLGLLRVLTGSAEDGFAQVAASCDALAQIGGPDDHARGLTRLAMAHRLTDRMPDAVAALASAAELADGPLLAEILTDLAECTAALDSSRIAEALAHAVRAVSLYEEAVGACGGLRRAQRLAARLHAASGSLAEAYELFGAAAEAEDPHLRGTSLYDRGRIALELDRDEEAYRALSDAVADLLAAGDTVSTAYARVELAAAALSVGQPNDAADAAEEAVAVLDRLDDTGEAARARFLLARAYRETGQPEQALALLDLVASHCSATGNHAG
ncbi:MAG TPA: hypothetical protein VGX25_19460, partial [Actinophytocola sp.]|uniref:hypothetical protein n=1 Tax=Actinophytocola sp. TaxID=1872138 RepID=UPI002DDCC5CE